MGTALAQTLGSAGFERYQLQRNATGHLVIVGHLANEPIAMLVDTGGSSTVVDLAWCTERKIPLRATGNLGGGAGGVTLEIHAVDGVNLALGPQELRTDKLFALDMSHVNRGLENNGASKIVGVIGADVLANHAAVIDYSTESLFLKF